ncbi:Crp/Fnr family transcriptional regulator [Sphingobacterium sp. lm-10]|uniref:Crp/Fnr family transcriptional regulator n=1 Tax=Sphingobacterium sp. lm-10 TaxID=2944904 RepID=UPI0020229780|nr:Crp/Fnr family transcriptional regulator [Sphingobacterium sp. lm-10]MCL7987298.1 Crp/Fnr family transcriptional regulator [Sphingobacterium sp. lm-10]
MDSLIQTIKDQISISEEDILLIKSLFRKKELKKGEHLLSAGETCRYIVFIEQGLVRYYTNNDDAEPTYYFSKEGEFVCDYSSFLPQIPSTTNIQALEDTIVYRISKDGIQKFYDAVRNGERFGRKVIEQVFVNVLNQIISQYTDSPHNRYRKFLLDFPELVQRIPQYYIAAYVGVKPPSLSRIRKRLKLL